MHLPQVLEDLPSHNDGTISRPLSPGIPATCVPVFWVGPVFQIVRRKKELSFGPYSEPERQILVLFSEQELFLGSAFFLRVLNTD
jgi:hypothetical protein